MVERGVGETPHAVLVTREHAALDAGIWKGPTDRLNHDRQATAKLRRGGRLTVVIVRIHVEIRHLPTPDGAVEASAVAGVSIFPHRERQDGAAKDDTQIFKSASSPHPDFRAALRLNSPVCSKGVDGLHVQSGVPEEGQEGGAGLSALLDRASPRLPK